MKKKRRPKADQAAHRPFEALDRLLFDAGLSLDPPPAQPDDPPASAEEAKDEDTDEESFARAMEGVQKPPWRHKLIRTTPPPSPLPEHPGLEDLRLMREAVRGNPAMSVPDHPEYIEGWVGICGKHFLPKLRAGLYSIQAQIDLHGLSRDAARTEVERFIIENARYRACCIKVIHGRGINSPDSHPVLKQHLQDWLSTRRMSRYVVAFASAQPADGGVGALYVLLRRRLTAG